jgi:hypothetical protein
MGRLECEAMVLPTQQERLFHRLCARALFRSNWDTKSDSHRGFSPTWVRYLLMRDKLCDRLYLSSQLFRLHYTGPGSDIVPIHRLAFLFLEIPFCVISSNQNVFGLIVVPCTAQQEANSIVLHKNWFQADVHVSHLSCPHSQLVEVKAAGNANTIRLPVLVVTQYKISGRNPVKTLNCKFPIMRRKEVKIAPFGTDCLTPFWVFSPYIITSNNKVYWYLRTLSDSESRTKMLINLDQYL